MFGSVGLTVTNITIVLDLLCGNPPVRSTEAFRLLSQGGDSSCSCTSKYTRLHAWTLSCTSNRWYKVDPSDGEVESNSHCYSALYSRLNSKWEPYNNITLIRHMQYHEILKLLQLCCICWTNTDYHLRGGHLLLLSLRQWDYCLSA